MAQCLTPYSIKNPSPTGERVIPVPCGKCVECRKNRANQWHFRLRQEEKRSHNAVFLTLTYDTDHVPITPKGYMSLDKKSHLTKFLNLLRKWHYRNDKYGKDWRIKYYLCGEYGTLSDRPHYHAIMFNVDKLAIAECWQYGDIHIGDVTGASLMYTLKYMVKEGKIPKHQNDDRIPEFSRMSKKLGSNYLDDERNVKWHKADINRNYIVDLGGIKIPLPRYYRERIYTESERIRQRKRIIKMQNEAEEKRLRDFCRKYGDDFDKYAMRKHQRKINKLNFNNINVNRNKI